MDEQEQRIIELEKQFQAHDHDGINTNHIRQVSFLTTSLPGSNAATAGNYGIFFVATRPCKITAISEVHTTLGSSTPTLQIEKLTGTQALDAGTTLLATAFDLHATANTVQRGVLVSGGLQTALSLKQGDRLALKDIGTLTALAGVSVTVQLELR